MPDVILVSAGSLPALISVPGLITYLMDTRVHIVVLCQFNAECLPISPFERAAIRELLKKAASAIFVSQQNLRLAERQFALELASAEVIYNPIRGELLAPLHFPEHQGLAMFASVARFETLWKGQDLLLDVLSSSSWSDRPWSLRFYGEGPDLKHVKRFASMRNLTAKATFEGYVRDVESIWKVCQVMLLASRGEGTPLALLEAMMCGRPVVTTDVGGNSEVVEDGVTGFIADAATPKSFGAAMERAWKARGQWREMGVAAHSRARELMKVAPSARLLKLLEEIVDE
jgi:glycosyltransferase involved in cell wall biosynthesis